MNARQLRQQLENGEEVQEEEEEREREIEEEDEGDDEDEEVIFLHQTSKGKGRDTSTTTNEDSPANSKKAIFRKVPDDRPEFRGRALRWEDYLILPNNHGGWDREAFVGL